MVFSLLYTFGGYHQIPQGDSSAASSTCWWSALLTLVVVVLAGHVGVYFRGGALLSHIEEPGFHTMLPVVTQMVPVQVTIQTDSVNDIPCGTSGGVMILFDKVSDHSTCCDELWTY